MSVINPAPRAEEPKPFGKWYVWMRRNCDSATAINGHPKSYEPFNIMGTGGVFADAPGYLFARFGLLEYSQLRYAHGVIGIVRFGDRYATIEEGALAPLWDNTDFAEIKELNYQLSQGHRVNITEGAFVGLEAVVTRFYRPNSG